MEFHSVTVNGSGASDAVELSSHSAAGSRSSSSQSSPHNNSLAASSPDLSFPCSPQAQQSTSVSTTVVSAVSSAHLPPLRLTKVEVLKSLKESIPHTMMLRQLQKSERAYQKDASWHKKAVRRISKELYLIVSMYALLQGVLFTAVAQASVFTCADWWGPAGIVSAVTLGTINGVLDKLRRMESEKQEAKKFVTRQSAVNDKIEQLYFRGSACNIESLEPTHMEAFDTAASIRCIFSVHGLLVLGFLVGFSALIMGSCTQMLCRSCHCT